MSNDAASLDERNEGFDDESETPVNGAKAALQLWSASKGQRWRLVVAVLCALLYVTFSIAAPAYSARVVDVLWTNIQAAFAEGKTFWVTLDNGGSTILTFLGIWTIALVFYSIQVFVMASFAERLNLSMRRRIADKLARLPLSFYDGKQPGDLISRATNDLDKVSEVLQRGLLQLVVSVGTFIGALVVMFVFSPLLTLVFCVFAAAAVVATRIIARKTIRVASARQGALGELTAKVEEAYTGRAIVKAFGREQATASEISVAADKLAHASAMADFLTNAAGPAVRFLMRLGQVTLGVMAGAMLIAGRLTIGTFQAFFQFVTQSSEPLTQVSMTVNMLQAALAAAERVFALLDADEIEPDPAWPARLAEPVLGHIEFEHVRFGYDLEHPLMSDVNLVARPGQKIAIVGATGAGKTTLINLLMRFYEINGGRITLDGIDVRELTRADLRRQFGMVLQDAWLFEGTIAENIAYGRPGATREEVEAAARAAHVDFFIRTLSDDYDTMLSNDAENVSQGQRQLLTIARAMLADPAILILDEATSSVDTRTEQAIGRAMNAIMEDRTSFVIAHRLSTIVDADLILVMDHGNIIEQGTHQQLLAQGGFYADLYQSQFA